MHFRKEHLRGKVLSLRPIKSARWKCVFLPVVKWYLPDVFIHSKSYNLIRVNNVI